jgi:hypothetical protein
MSEDSLENSMSKRQLLGVMAHTCNPRTQEAKAGVSQVQDQPGRCSETLSQENKTKETITKQKQQCIAKI